MGAGSFGAGIGPAGFDPPATTTRALVVPPEAVMFDLATRSFPFENGQAKAIHPVDQWVAIVLGVALGSLPQDATTGLDIDRIRKASRAAMQSTITDEVNRVLAPKIASGDILFLGAPLMPNANGRPFFFVDYRNLRLPSSAPDRKIPVQR